MHARIGPLRFELRAAGVGTAPRFEGTPLPALSCECVVSINERGTIYLLVDHRDRTAAASVVYG
jgi:hypothetical protein